MAPHALPPSAHDTIMQDVAGARTASSKSEMVVEELVLPKPAGPSGSIHVKRTLVPATNGHKQASTQVTPKYSIHIEVGLKPQSTASFETIENLVRKWIASDLDSLMPESALTGWEWMGGLSGSVQSIRVAETSYGKEQFDPAETRLNVHVYSPNTAHTEELISDGAEEGQSVNSATMCLMPNISAEGLWESLFYADDVKIDLLNYIYATIRFSQANVDTNIVAWNRVVLLHGPPGTGKTSLCRALAQKLSIRLGKVYPITHFIEINSHSLFSRWFSESGKLVQNLFTRVMELCEEEETFVVVLIDEVESITASRSGSVSAGEPTDAIRVVNALLTQLDKLKQLKNVLVVTTSNLVDSIDPAFKDRADIVKFIGNPPQDGVYWILRGCLLELMERGVIEKDVNILDLRDRRIALASNEREQQVSERLFELAAICQGMSGRSLRRLPVLAASKHLGAASFDVAVPIEEFLEAMKSVVEAGIAQDSA